MKKAEQLLSNYENLYVDYGGELLFPIRLADMFLESALNLDFFFYGYTAWHYVKPPDGKIGIMNDYEYDFFISDEGNTHQIPLNSESILSANN